MSDFPKGWIATTIGTVCDVILGQSPPGSAYNSHGHGLPFFQGKAEFGALYPVVQKWTTAGNKRALPGDVLVSVRAPVGPTNLAPFECVIGRGLAALRPTPLTTTLFVLYQMRAIQMSLASIATGSTFSAISGDQLRNHRFMLPPLAEQHRIVAAIEEQLSRLDSAEKLLRSVRRRLDLWVTSFIDAATDGFGTARLGDLIREPLRNGHSAKRSATGTVPVLTLTAVTSRDFSRYNTKLTDADPHRVGDLWIEPGDIFIERSNTPELVGTAALYSGPTGRAIFPDLLIRVRCGPQLLPEYADLALRATKIRRYFQRVAKGIAGSMPKIDQEAVLAADLPLPPLAVQAHLANEVARCLSVAESLATTLDHSLKRSGQLRSAVMQRALTGKLVPQNPDDEPVPELLTRIASHVRSSAKPGRRSCG